jgi:2-polyprenyl-3-methyl-5-hydroxy-6-metoxy-1,4-benzoquinol methylase
VSIQDTYRIEVAKWDGVASAPRSDESLRLADPDFGAYARPCRTMTGMAEFLGDLRGREVLEYGCGLGMLSTLLALSGARVTAFDLSPASIEVARRRAELHGVADAIEFDVAAGESLPYADESFDVVVGKAVLHHLDVKLAGPELHRVLRPGGRAAFSEPLGTNPLLVLARDHLPYAHKNARGADSPLSAAEVAAWGAPFREFHHREIQLLTMAERALGLRPVPGLARADAWLLGRFPALRRYCRYVVLAMVR